MTPASPEDLPPLGELIVDDPFWRYPSASPAREGVAHLRVWMTLAVPPGHLAVVTDTGSAGAVTKSAAYIRAGLVRVYGPSLVLIEHRASGETGHPGNLDLVRIGGNGEPHWTRVWPTEQDNPRHAGLEAWMAAHGHQIVGTGC
jgi:hypothetical protein